MWQGLVLDVAEQLFEYSIDMENQPDARLQDAIFMRLQAERLVAQIERSRGGKET
jgi:hypothetical protein